MQIPYEDVCSRGFPTDFQQYQWFTTEADEAYKKRQFEKSLQFAHLAATFAWQIHLGFWYDSELELLLKKIGQAIGEGVPQQPNRVSDGKKARAIVHVATALYEMGGHSKVVRTWINALQDSCSQVLYITDDPAPPVSFLEDFNAKGIKVTRYPANAPYVDRVKDLIADIALEQPEKIVLYIHPNDVLTVAALHGLKNKVPVVFFNHSDHFWVGRDVVNHLVEWRKESVKYSQKYRQITDISIIPLVFDIKTTKHDKDHLKTDFGIPQTATVSLTVGREEKVTGDPDWNYYSTIEKLLAKNPNHYHISIGTPLKNPSMDPNVSKRFINLDRSPNVSIFYNMADFLIESFPAIGGTVRVEAIAYHLPIVAAHNRKFSLLSDSDAIPTDYPFKASTTDEVIDFSSQFIRNSDLRTKIGTELSKYYNDNFDYENIKKLVLKTFLGEPEHVIVEEDCTYDAAYLYQWTKRAQSKYLRWVLMEYACIKCLPLKDRIKLYSYALKSGSLDNKQKVTEFLLASGGINAYRFILNLSGNRHKKKIDK
jgi:glycosyltransferase involved in cell wall biosynthesis